MIAHNRHLGQDGAEPLLLARMLQVSLVAYLSGGAFLSLSYFDLPWHLIAVALLLGGLYPKTAAASSATGLSRHNLTRHAPPNTVRHIPSRLPDGH